MQKAITIIRALGTILVLTTLGVGYTAIRCLQSSIAVLAIVLIAAPFFAMGCIYIQITEEKLISVLTSPRSRRKKGDKK